MANNVANAPFELPAAFAIVAPRLYRSSSSFSGHQLAFLESLQLKTIISLSSELPSKSLQLWIDAHKVDFVHLGNRPLSAQRTWRPMSEELVKEAIERILDKDTAPCLVVDSSGIYETGMVIAILRRLQGWTLSACLAEYSSIAGSKTRSSNEQFIELYDLDLVILPTTDRLPSWFTPPSP